MLLASGGIQCFAQQTFLSHTIQYTPKETPIRNFDAEVYRSKLLTKYTPLFKKDDELKDFVETLVEGKEYYLATNTEYESWEEANKYLLSILDQLDYKAQLNQPVTIKIIRDPSVNACAFEDGVIYFNVGFLARVNNEAEIAAVLGHELGHVIKMHEYENYKARKKYFRSIYLAYHTSNRPTLGALINGRKSSNVLVANEKESDDIAYALMYSSRFNTDAIPSVFSRFVTLEKKYRAEKNYESNASVFYLQTHPESESRVIKMKGMKKNNGKNFIVDSLYFTRLKKNCIDETINLQFENLEFNDCIETSFVQYLKYPNDAFYLFYLTESARRLLEIDAKAADMYFITGRYRDYFNMSGLKKSVKPHAVVNGIIKPYDDSFRNSIFFRYLGPLLMTDSSDYRAFGNNPILTTDTLPFLTNRDAVEYFKRTNTKLGYSLNNSFLGGACTQALTAREKFVCDLPANVDKFMKESSNDRVLWVLYNVDHIKFEQNGILNQDVEFIRNTENTFYNELKSRGYDKYISLGSDLYFDEKSHLENYLELIYPLIKNQELKPLKLPSVSALMAGQFKIDPEDIITREEAKFKCSSVTPELVNLLKEHGYKGIVFSSVHITNESQSAGLSSVKSERWIVKHFYLDAKKERVKFYMTWWGIGETQSKVSWLPSYNYTGVADFSGGFFESIKDVSK